ncbi:unnamed protein product [Phytophthora fragariaefolia]|uniref:Unnamed protein product n=1 Tax=Phytophthora fragariaefolia TaxID=1490495 RepID=A0A9W6Y6M2_9STRA|nr:unnamed protein product [Phytophthora fragariaefolia]
MPGWVYKVKRALYGLHESGREWYDEPHGCLSAKGLRRSSTEPCLYFYEQDGVIAIVLVYVDDIICATDKEGWKTRFFAELNQKYGLKDLGRLNNYLEIQVDWKEDGILPHQSNYAQEVLTRFGFADAVGCMQIANGHDCQVEGGERRRLGTYPTLP